MDGSENPESMSRVIEFILQNPILAPFRSELRDGVESRIEKSSSLTRSKFVRVGVWSGVSTAEDESQSDPSGVNVELMDELEEKEDDAE
jgi:hypothetical protein